MEGCVHRAENIGELDELVRNLSTEGFRIVSVLDSTGAYVVVAQLVITQAIITAELSDEEMRKLQKAAGRVEILPDYP